MLQYTRDGAIADLIDGVDPGLVDLPAKDRELAFHRQGRMGTADVNAQMAHEGGECRLDVGRVLHQQADETKRPQSVLLADEDAEVRAARPVRAVLDDTVVSRERDDVLRVVEQFQVDANLRQHFARIGTQPANEFRK